MLLSIFEISKKIPKSINKNLGMTKMGGNPDWIQEKETLLCPVCHKPMVFYGQLDSQYGPYQIGDCGMIYVFCCKQHWEFGATAQCY